MTLPDFSQAGQFKELREEMGITTTTNQGDTMNEAAKQTTIQANEISVTLRALGLLKDATLLTIDEETALDDVTARLRVLQANARV